MPIVYACVARGGVILAEYAAVEGNISSAAQMLLEKVEPLLESRRSYLYDGFVFHLFIANGISFLCVTDSDFSGTVAHAFLDDVKHRFVASYGRVDASVARPMAMQADFAKSLSRQAAFFSFDPSASRVSVIRSVSQQQRTHAPPPRPPKALFTSLSSSSSSSRPAGSVDVEPVEVLLGDGERDKLLVRSADDERTLLGDNIPSHTEHFVRARRKRNAALVAAIVGTSVLLVWLILSLVCGFSFTRCTEESLFNTTATTKKQ